MRQDLALKTTHFYADATTVEMICQREYLGIFFEAKAQIPTINGLILQHKLVVIILLSSRCLLKHVKAFLSQKNNVLDVDKLFIKCAALIITAAYTQ